MKENNKGLVVLVIVLIIIILGLGGYVVYDKIFASKTVENNMQAEENNNVEQQKNYKSYNIGDKVDLLDSSQWNVLEKSDTDSEFVTLLSINNINNGLNITFTDAPSYISTTYKSNLVKQLNANENGVKDARLLTLEDISKLSDIETANLTPGTSLENNVTPSFLYQSDTITSSVNLGSPIMVCNAVPEQYESNPGRMCIGTQTNIFPIRPVIVVSKDYIK